MNYDIHDEHGRCSWTDVSSNPNSTTYESCDFDQITYSTWNVLSASQFNIFLKGLEDRSIHPVGNKAGSVLTFIGHYL